ncbi:MAG: GNAT family N-acetyltransferase [Caldilineaceae bacterium]|nr:GNAT family N-acetyltransferase [Caldilineaceae bacterium]
MLITDNSFTNRDDEYDRIKRLLLEIEARPEVDNNWDPGRMDWWRYNIHVEKEPDFFAANAHYWQTETGRVVGLFISEYGRDDFFAVVHPDFFEILPDVLQWGLAHWARGKAKISTAVFSYSRPKIAQLLAAGFYEDGPEENLRTYTLHDYDFRYGLQPGFKLMTFPEYGNYDSRVKLVHNAFGNLAYNETRLRSLQSSPAYLPELDLVIVDVRGESVAYCMGWVTEYDPTAGYIEPMGVHSGHRRQGFGTALAKECFKRLADLGVARATIASHSEPDVSNFLYESLQPTGIKRAYRYSLNR